MTGFIDTSLSRSRLVVAALIFILLAGWIAWRDIPKESEPDVRIPIIFVRMTHEGISPEDAERLLVRPMEQELRSIEGIKEMRSTAFEGGGNVVLEFQPGFDARRAISDVRAKVDDAKRDLPRDADEPKVAEVNLSLFPVLVVTRGPNGAVALSGGERAEVEAEPIDHVVDTTGAGDLFAAGFLFAHVRGMPLGKCLKLGAICACEVISHYGARPEKNLQALMAERLG